MKPSKLYEALHALIGERVPLHIWGACGVGKSQIVAQVAVSYTHLDVYKRQLLPWPLSGISRTTAASAPARCDGDVYKRQHTRSAWSRYGRPIVMALPVPPAPMTRTRIGLRASARRESMCSMRMIALLSAHELLERLGQLNQCLGWKTPALVFEQFPKTLETALVTRCLLYTSRCV